MTHTRARVTMTPMQPQLISFIFSFRNEEATLPELVTRVAATMSTVCDATYELVFVNDASTDGSLQSLRTLAQDYPIRIVNTSRTFGVTPCVIAGMQYAKGDAIVYMDADLQDPPELVPNLIAEFRNGADVVHTTRTRRDGEGWAKMWLTKCAYRIINICSDIALPENTGDFKLLSRRATDHILQLREYDPYMRGLSVWIGFRQVFINYQRERRFAGQPKFPLLSRGPIREFIRGLTAYSAGPLYLAFAFSLAGAVFAAIVIGYAIVVKVMGDAAAGSSGVLIAIAVFSTMILLSQGLMGIYVARIYYEGKSRPRFIIDEVIEPERRGVNSN